MVFQTLVLIIGVSIYITRFLNIEVILTNFRTLVGNSFYVYNLAKIFFVLNNLALVELSTQKTRLGFKACFLIYSYIHNKMVLQIPFSLQLFI